MRALISRPRSPPPLVLRDLLPAAARSSPSSPPRASRPASSTLPSPPLSPSRSPPRLLAASPSPPARSASPAPPTALFSARVRPLAPPALFLRHWPLSPPRIPPPPPPSPHAASSGSVARHSPPRAVVLTFEHLLCCAYRSLYPTPRPRVGVRTFKHLPPRRC